MEQCLLLKDLQILCLKKVFRVKFNFEQSYDVYGNGKLGFSVTTSLFMTLIEAEDGTFIQSSITTIFLTTG